MQTHTNTTTGNQHRHWVVAPVFLLVFAASISPIFTSDTRWTSAVVTVAAEQDQPFAFATGQRGVAYHGAQIEEGEDGIALKEGSILVSSESVLRVRAGDITILGYAGAAHVTVDGTAITVAALRNPVLVLHGEHAIFVPSARQGSWRWNDVPTAFDADLSLRQTRETGDMPADLRAEYLRVLAALPSDSGPSLDSSLEDLRSSKEEAATHEAFVRLKTAVRANDAVATAAATREDGDALSADPIRAGKEVAQLLEPGLRDSVLSLLLSVLPVDDPLLLLATLHPALQPAAWAQDARYTGDAEVLSLLHLPVSDLQQEALPDLIVDWWQGEAQAWLEWAADPVPSLQKLLDASALPRTLFEHYGYPERRERYAVALQEIAEPFRDSWTLEIQAQLEAWSAEPPVELPPVAPEPETASSSVAAVALTPADLAANEASAKDHLRSAGALFGLTSTVHAEPDGSVIAHSIVFSGSDGEHLYDFQLVDGEVRNIQRDGAIFPLPMPLEAFTKWAKGQE